MTEMTKKSERYPNPRFSNLEEEHKYWETHSPLEEGYEGEVQTGEQRRSSFLSVRMTGDELSRLRAAAAKQGLGPSTYARLLIRMLLDGNANCPALSAISYPSSLPGANRTEADFVRIQHKIHDKIESNPEDIYMYVLKTADVTANRQAVSYLLEALGSLCTTHRVVTRDDADYEKVEPLVRISE